MIYLWLFDVVLRGLITSNPYLTKGASIGILNCSTKLGIGSDLFKWHILQMKIYFFI